MMLPWRGLVRGTHTTTRRPSSLAAAFSLTLASSPAPPRVSFATTRTVLTRPASYSAVVVAWVPAGAGTSAPLKTPCTAPGTPYSYGPPTTVGIASKLKIGGGEEPCHSSVSARHGFATARGPPRHEAIML